MNEEHAQIFTPTFEEMRSPDRLPEDLREAARLARADELDPMNMFNIHWKDDLGDPMALVMPPDLTGVSAPIAVLLGQKFPTRAHAVGPAYAMIIEKELQGEIARGAHRLLFPSGGSFGVSAAWVAARLGYEATVIAPEGTPASRVEAVERYGARAVTTPVDPQDTRRLAQAARGEARDAADVVLDPARDFACYRFHATVTAAAVEQLAASLERQSIGGGRVAAFVSAIGTAATLGAGDRLKETQGSAIVGVEPVQCPTLFEVGTGSHHLEGMGAGHVGWIHNVHQMDAVACVDELDVLRGLALLDQGAEILSSELGVPEEAASRLAGPFGPSGLAGVLGAIKAAKYFGFGPDDLIVTVAPDGSDRYPWVNAWLEPRDGPPSRALSLRRLEIFRRAQTDWVLEASRPVRRRWHNQKHFTWVEQEGKTADALEAQRDPGFWREQRARADTLDAILLKDRGAA